MKDDIELATPPANQKSAFAVSKSPRTVRHALFITEEKALRRCATAVQNKHSLKTVRCASITACNSLILINNREKSIGTSYDCYLKQVCTVWFVIF